MDAEPAPIPGDRPRVRPRHAAIWIRVEGAWRAGTIQDWYRDGGAWAVWVRHERPDGEPWPHFAGYRYDPVTVLRREPGESAPG